MNLHHANVHFSADVGIKGLNRPEFEKQLVENLRVLLGGEDIVSIRRQHSRLLIKFGDSFNRARVRELLANCFGISWFSFCTATSTDASEISKAIADSYITKNTKSFYIKAKRSDKSFPLSSQELGKQVAEKVAQLTGAQAELDAEKKIYVEITSGKALAYDEKIQGLGGLPVGTSGKVLCLLSGGIDSPVAAYLMAKRGCSVDYVHFHAYKEGEPEKLEKIRKLAQILSRQTLNSRIHFIPFYPFLAASLKIPSRYALIAFRRFMVRLASRLAEKESAYALASGESLGQVASQTLRNMATIEQSSTLPILRPLISFDKDEITHLAERIGTYGLSLQPHRDCCQSLTDRHPATSAPARLMQKFEAELEMDKLVDDTLALVETEEIVYEPAAKPVPARA